MKESRFPWAAEPAHRAASVLTDIYSYHARLPLAGPRRLLAPGLQASPLLESMNITGPNSYNFCPLLNTTFVPCNDHITSIELQIAGDLKPLLFSMNPGKEESSVSS